MEALNEFFSNYLIEVILLILVIFFLLLFVIIKQKSDKPKDLKQHEEHHEEKKPIHIFSDKQEEETLEKLHESEGEEEGLVPQEEVSKEEPAPTVKGITYKIIEKRRELPAAHGPITKESFEIFNGLKLLVAEDNMINQKVINGILGDSGMQIVMANDGQEALDILAEDKDFSIVLMDAHMPRIDGFEATKRIKADHSLDHILVVALSGDTAADDIKKMYNAGMQEHLEKPLKMDKLFEVLYCYMDLKDSDTQPEEKSVAKSGNAILNIQEGMDVCGGDEELYKEILNEFLTMYADADKKIKSLMAKDHLDHAKNLLLDISGISANIGADMLAETSTKFREDIINNEETKFLENEERFTELFIQVQKEIEHFMS